MSKLKVYFARAMDARKVNEIIADDEKYAELLTSIGCTIINTYKEKKKNPMEDGGDIAQRDLALLMGSDIVLADISIPDYQYVGCIFEIVHAANIGIPVIIVEGERDFHNRYFIQAYCNFIARTAEEAVEYIRRTNTGEGVEEQMKEMHAYYNKIADGYQSNYSGSDRHREVQYRQEREELRMVIKKYVKGDTLQIGIGTGDWTRTVCESADRVIGVDQGEEMIARARINLSSFNNIDFLHGDIFKLKNGINTGPFDCVVVYFLLSLLPSSLQKRLLDIIRELLKPGGLFITADTRKMREFDSIGLGRHRLQHRESAGRTYTLYKENFYGESLVNLLKQEGFKIIDTNRGSTWFSWAVASLAG